MIRVTCGQCGSVFGAKDEFAGRKGRCPKCKSDVVVPAAGAAPPAAAQATGKAPARASAPAPATARAPAPSAAPAPRRASGAPASGRAARGARAKRSGDAGAWIVRGAVVVVLAVIGFFVWSNTRGPDTVAIVQEGRDAMQRTDFAAAIAAFERVPAGDPLYAQAQEKLAEARELQAADAAREDSRMADNLAGVLDRLRKDYVDGPGNADPGYEPNCRYMLKRTREFLDRYPDHPRAVEFKGWFPYYAQVASLDKPPTEADVRAEMNFRFQVNQYKEAMAAVVEGAQQSADVDKVSEELKRKVIEQANLGWAQTRSQLEDALVAGQENWNKVQARTKRYLDSVEGLPGVGDEARALYKRALAAMQAEG